MSNEIEKYDDELLSVSELSEKFNVSERTVWRLIADGCVEPEELRVNPQGSKTPYYSLQKCAIARGTLLKTSSMEKFNEAFETLPPDVKAELEESLRKGKLLEKLIAEQAIDKVARDLQTIIDQKNLIIEQLQGEVATTKDLLDGVTKQCRRFMKEKDVLYNMLRDICNKYKSVRNYLRDLYEDFDK
jgi:hypothetical protein